RAHLELQVMRLALLDKSAYLADPRYVKVPADGLLEGAYLAERRALIEYGPLGPEPGPGVPPAIEGRGGVRGQAAAAEQGETTHFGTIDRWGNLVCCTSTIEDFCGS